MTTEIRIQKHMANSVGALAIERQRLEEEITRLSTGLPAEAAEVVRRADEILASHGERIAELKARRDEIDRTFSVTEHERREATEQRRQAELAADRKALADAAEAVLGHMEAAQEHLRSFVNSVNAALAAHRRARATAARLTGGARLPVGFAVGDVVARLGGSISGMLARIKVPGALPGGAVRIGSLDLPTSPHSADADWSERERRAIGPAVHELLNGRNASNG